MSAEENRVIMSRFCEAFTAQDPDALRQVVAPELAREIIEEWFPANNASISDHCIEIAEFMSEGDRVATLLATSGRHTGEYLGLPATGNAWTNQVAVFCRMADGKIVEWVAIIPNIDNQVRQMGGVLSAIPA